ncbi:hypothetical protein KC335_g62 [Hortaea werneckii]|nr:hypothetical protein KC335_g62 [Hortaea werneckii]
MLVSRLTYRRLLRYALQFSKSLGDRINVPGSAAVGSGSGLGDGCFACQVFALLLAPNCGFTGAAVLAELSGMVAGAQVFR